ncbi:MAG: type II secretion system protein [Patescibacteria group bacterium]
MNVQKQQKGFTIIEVVLVLAIAGLIFLMIFIALPALQRGQRDTQRRDDSSRFVTQLNSYSTNNNGRIPTFAQITASGADSFRVRYLKQDLGNEENSEFRDPRTGANYTIAAALPTDPDADVFYSTFQYVTGQRCNGEALVAAGGSRVAAIRINLEGSGIFCQDNQ